DALPQVHHDTTGATQTMSELSQVDPEGWVYFTTLNEGRARLTGQNIFTHETITAPPMTLHQGVGWPVSDIAPNLVAFPAGSSFDTTVPYLRVEHEFLYLWDKDSGVVRPIHSFNNYYEGMGQFMPGAGETRYFIFGERDGSGKICLFMKDLQEEGVVTTRGSLQPQ
ncbi:hypothetical protein KJ865_16160, partial [Myxococcota bacterium]|nr:hypothetical protein [Myxococcota bacterium]